MSKRKTTEKTATKDVEKKAETAAPAKKLSLLSAAAQVLKESDEPLNCKQMIRLAKERGLWEQGAGKTPEQTLYSAIAREIKDKGEASRFKKSELRGHYSAS